MKTYNIVKYSKTSQVNHILQMFLQRIHYEKLLKVAI